MSSTIELPRGWNRQRDNLSSIPRLVSACIGAPLPCTAGRRGNDPGHGQGPLEQRQVDQIGTGQLLGDAGKRLAARFTLIGLSARANA